MKKSFLFYLKLVFVVLMFVFISCAEEEEDPGPITVDNVFTPSVLFSGETIVWEIKVTNAGEVVEIDRVNVSEEFISGWAEGMGSVQVDLPISKIEVPAHSTKVIYSKSLPVTNTGTGDVEAKNTVTVYSNGGTDSDFTVYKIKVNSKKSAETPVCETIINR